MNRLVRQCQNSNSYNKEENIAIETLATDLDKILLHLEDLMSKHDPYCSSLIFKSLLDISSMYRELKLIVAKLNGEFED